MSTETVVILMLLAFIAGMVTAVMLLRPFAAGR
jgi:hypothetical protein